MLLRRRKKIRRFEIDKKHLQSEGWWKRWILDVGHGFYYWDEPMNKGRFVSGGNSFDFERTKEYERVILCIKLGGRVVFGKDLPREKICAGHPTRARIII